MILTFLALAALLQTPKDDDAPKWETYTSAAGFSVAVPGVPVEQKKKVGASNESVTLISKGGDSVYMVIRIDNEKPVPKAMESQFFKEVRQGLDTTAKVSSEKKIAHAGRAGGEYVYEIKGQGGETLVVNSRYILMSPEVTYNMQIIRAKDKPAAGAKEMAAFFDSLKIVDLATAAKMANSKLAFKAFAPKGMGFSILMPGKPEETTKENKTEKGSFNLRTYECAGAAGSYSVSVLEYGPEVGNAAAATKTEMLLRMCDALVTQDKGETAQQQSTEFQGFPARMIRWKFSVPGVNAVRVAECRAVMAGAKVFLVMVKCPQDLVDPADPDKFFESFKLTDAKATAVASADPAPAAAANRGRPATAPRLAGRMPAKGAAANRAGRVAAAPRPPRPERISWKRYNSAAGGFNINMPGEPTPSHEDDGLLGSKGVEILTAEHEESRFIVQYQDLSRTAQKKGSSGVLKAARASDEKVISGKVVGEKEAMLKGAVGWSYQIESPEPDGPMARIRSYVVGTRLYQIIVVAPKTKFPTDDSERFLSSFKLQARN